MHFIKKFGDLLHLIQHNVCDLAWLGFNNRIQLARVEKELLFYSGV